MLLKVIKRDGTEENFIPNKINKWAEWASSTVKENINWSSIVIETFKELDDKINTQDLQLKLIQKCIEKKTWSYNIMAGNLYIAYLYKDMYGFEIPKLHTLHEKLFNLGLMKKLNYTLDEYFLINQFISHPKDFEYTHFQIKQIVKKYSIQNKIENISYETPQFVFMRMAMALAEDIQENKIDYVKKFYQYFSNLVINAPTPNYTNLGTNNNGYQSCCLYSVDDNAESLAIGDHIAYTMTYMSAGIGSHLNTRSIEDPVRGGLIEHQGKLPYFRSLAGAVKANLQGGRGGACTTYYTCFDPEVNIITMLQNPRTVKEKQNRNIHFALITNTFFAKKVIYNKNIFTFNIFTAPDLTNLFYSNKLEEFEELYRQYEENPNFKKNYISARSIIIKALQQSLEVGTLYLLNIDEVNNHTPFKETIYSSNLCLEICEPTKPYSNMMDLYNELSEDSEVATCNLAAININMIKTDKEYEEAMYYALLMIDKTIHKTQYKLPHIGYTAKNRLNAGVGIIGLAYYLAKLNLKYDTPEGLREIHRVAERHMYFAIKASLRLGKELGNAPWIHKTKWVDGWLPIDTYKKTVDEIIPNELVYDWETLRQEVINNKGIRNSTLVAHMPTESSSKACGVPNGLYPIRDLSLKKSDLKNVIDWVATESDTLKDNYQIAWTIDNIDLIKCYSVIQKFTDQAISADLYKDRITHPNVSTEELLKEYLTMVKYGLKSRYYYNSLVSAPTSFLILNNENEEVDNKSYIKENSSADLGCESGACTL